MSLWTAMQLPGANNRQDPFKYSPFARLATLTDKMSGVVLKNSGAIWDSNRNSGNVKRLLKYNDNFVGRRGECRGVHFRKGAAMCAGETE